MAPRYTPLPGRDELFPIRISDSDREGIRSLYQSQLPQIMELGANEDADFCTLLALQRKFDCDIFQFFVTDFHRWCLRSYNRKIQNQTDDDVDITVLKWMEQCPYFVSVGDKDKNTVKSAISSFGSRVYPRLMMQLSVYSE